MFSINYELTEEEYLNYNYYTAWLMPEKKAYRIKYYASMALLFFIVELGVFYILDNNQIKTNSIIILVVITIILLLLLPYRMKSVFNSRAKKLIAKSGPDTIFSATELTINENGLFGKNKVAEVKYQWAAFKKKIIQNNCYYLYINLQQAVVIPIRAFQSKEEKENFDALLARYLPLEAEFANYKKK
jgi:YcxB-like protein